MAIDRKKTLDDYRARRGEFRVVEVPARRYLMVDGQGDPNTSPLYADAIAALFPVAYALKAAVRREAGDDFVVMPLEALWWSDDMSTFTTRRDKARWRWTAMILVPDAVTASLFSEAIEEVAARKKPSRVRDVRLDVLEEGMCLQTLHVGPYDDEAAVLARLHEHEVPERGLRLTGRHHEIYVSDARRTAAERLRTILRQPVALDES
ncbi:hypothetical protein ELQ90_12310 [Labedella phragmitis]|uniref:GyrI-like small molecule binding domain-containing protein n=1 Tax=Labedella phragmitis TaxID=2498849 RepID=A0A3S4DDT0_9MICO|nr:GyrI-like domain-containing protein [Labedella phragmitis]RWZ49546.1 hypothetical protein ELQ90_12310 [Labedella phragmitis]